MSPEADPVAAALGLARERAGAARAAGGYVESVGEGGLRVQASDRISTQQLLDWAVIEPDLDHVRSTRRLGAPVTFFKRMLVRLLRQYLGQIVAEQTRFNLHVMIRVAELEDRITQLEDSHEDH